MQHLSFQFFKKGQALIESIAIVILGLVILLLFLRNVLKFTQTSGMIEKVNQGVRDAKSN